MSAAFSVLGGVRKTLFPSVGLKAVVAISAVVVLGYGQRPISEYTVKAAYLFNFGKFVRFSPTDQVSKSPTFDICIVGQDPLGRALGDLTANERLNGKPVRVLRPREAAEARDCGIAYITTADDSRAARALEELRGHSVLTVGEAPGFLQHDGIIRFVTVSNHIRFAVNLDAARAAHLNLSSELLRVALSVNGETPKEVQP